MKYGNCLIVALLAKIRNPKGIKIFYIPKHLGLSGNIPHFVWLDIKSNSVHHFIKSTKNHNYFWFKGEEKVVSKDVFDRFILNKIERHTDHIKDNLLKQYNVESTFNKFKWHDPLFGELPSYEDGLPYTNRIPYIEVIYGSKPDYNVCFMKIEKDKEINLPENTVFWRYQSIYNDTFNGLWNSAGKNCEYTKVDTDFGA